MKTSFGKNLLISMSLQFVMRTDLGVAVRYPKDSSSFAKLSLLTFTKADRVANVQIQNGSFGNNDVLITVAPSVRAGNARP